MKDSATTHASTTSEMRAALEATLREEPEPGEAVLWQGAPVVVAMCVSP